MEGFLLQAFIGKEFLSRRSKAKWTYNILSSEGCLYQIETQALPRTEMASSVSVHFSFHIDFHFFS